MKKHKKICFFILLTLLLNITGCTVYTEINNLPLILGVSIDKKNNDKYILTVEVFKPAVSSKEKNTEINTEILQAEGLTILDAIRNLVIKLGKRAYWTHLKVFIISKNIADEGISPILDMFNRNAHIRKEFPVLIANDENAYDIFYKGKEKLKEPVSIFLNDTVKSVDKVSKYDYVKFYELIDDISSEGQNLVLPLINMDSMEDEKIPLVYGLAVFKKDKMVGILDSNESKTLRLIKNKEKGGALIVQWSENNEQQNVTLGIIKSKTKLQLLYDEKNLNINIKTTSITEIVEIMNYKIDVLEENGRENLKKEAENKIKKDIETLLFKLQHELECDAIGIGKNIKEKHPNVWKKYENNWSNAFVSIQFNISVDVEIKGTASISEQLKVED
ncbi:Ger(x)C family spore germination protein [Clostridium sp. MSJ-4]|uniref:Ger(X)C family spore germination protein n=1 Tax=Clostridium simiarum TaxID=2841506 RepID=A0ABS6F3C4_9CLOT|nr:Ger(x)C family spore germination protein [Clostridium simiarum]MBU5593012.1 Ger(x)C family spore germination protein [Clostridium simiarum]